MGKVYERCVAGRDQECEALVAELVGLCPWMTGCDAVAVRHVFGAQIAMVAGEAMDVGWMAGCLLGRAMRAEVAGDVQRAWAFDQWYAWACAALLGEEYHWSELPAEVAGVS